MYEEDREEEISQSDVEPVENLPACEEESVVAMNTPDQNANAVEDLVFAMMLSRAKNRRTVAR